MSQLADTFADLPLEVRRLISEDHIKPFGAGVTNQMHVRAPNPYSLRYSPYQSENPFYTGKYGVKAIKTDGRKS